MSNENRFLKKKLIQLGLLLFFMQFMLMSCVMIFSGGQMMAIMPAAEIIFAEEYKRVGQKAFVNWVDMLIYDTVRYDNDLDKAEPTETVFDFLIIEYEKREERTEYIYDESGNLVWVYTYWVTLEKGFLQGKNQMKSKLNSWFSNARDYEFDEILDTFTRINNGEEYIIGFSSKDLEDLMVSFSEEQIEWVNLLIEGNFVYEMYGGVFDLPANIPVAGDVKFAWPTPTLRTITSHFGYRIHPVTSNREFHYGTDISGANAMGQPIISVADGVVYQVNYTNESTAGYNVRIKHIDEEGNEWESRYCHMSQINVTVGAALRQGDVIGAVGNTGRSTGPHLHFELRFSGQLIDPYLYINQ